MRKCPECQRVYYDEKLNFCLDDGTELLHGPASDEPATIQLGALGVPTSGGSSADEKTRTLINRTHEDRTPTLTNKRFLLAISGLAVLIIGGFAGYRYFGSGRADQITSVAVLPFANESDSPAVEYLSDGISETLINSLTEIPTLTVKPRSSAFRYKGRESEAKTIGSELGVGAIVTGRLTQSGDDITLFIRLVDTGSENQIWGQQYQRKLANLVSLQTEIARDVSANLRTRLTGAGEARAQKNYSANPEAYRLYLQGRYHWNKRSRRDIELAIEYFRQSTARDPRFAAAFAGLADSLTIIGGYTGTATHESITDARVAAQTALSLDPDSAEAHISLGSIFLYYDHDFAAAERELRRAVELDPRSGHAHQMTALVHLANGKFDPAFDEYRQALELEPVSLPINRGLALLLTYARRYDESVAQFRKTIELDPGFGLAYYGLANALAYQKKYAESVDAYAKGLEVSGSPEAATVVRSAFATGGWDAHVRALLEQRPARRTPTPHFVRAIYFTELGDRDSAIAELQESYADREGFIMLAHIHPSFDPLRDDPRFQEIVKRVTSPK